MKQLTRRGQPGRKSRYYVKQLTRRGQTSRKSRNYENQLTRRGQKGRKSRYYENQLTRRGQTGRKSRYYEKKENNFERNENWYSKIFLNFSPLNLVFLDLMLNVVILCTRSI